MPIPSDFLNLNSPQLAAGRVHYITDVFSPKTGCRAPGSKSNGLRTVVILI